VVDRTKEKELSNNDSEGNMIYQDLLEGTDNESDILRYMPISLEDKLGEFYVLTGYLFVLNLWIFLLPGTVSGVEAGNYFVLIVSLALAIASIIIAWLWPIIFLMIAALDPSGLFFILLPLIISFLYTFNIFNIRLFILRRLSKNQRDWIYQKLFFYPPSSSASNTGVMRLMDELMEEQKIKEME